MNATKKKRTKRPKRLTRKECMSLTPDELRASIEAHLWALKGCHDREAMKDFIAVTEADIKLLTAVREKRGISLIPEPPAIPPARELCETAWREHEHFERSILGHGDTYLPGWTWTLLREMLACIATCARSARDLEINEKEKEGKG